MIYGWWPDKLQRDAARWVSRAAALGCLTFGTGALLRDDVANGFEALFIIARRLLDILGEHAHHGGLELDERLGRVEPDGGAGSHPAFLFSGNAAGVQALISHDVSLLFVFFFAPAAST